MTVFVCSVPVSVDVLGRRRRGLTVFVCSVPVCVGVCWCVRAEEEARVDCVCV